MGALILPALLMVELHTNAQSNGALVGQPRPAPPDPADKAQYTLFNPVPKQYMRELNTDRPDKTEGPFTVDAGHYQIESDIFTYSQYHDTSGGANTSVDGWSFATLNLRAGLCNQADLQVILNPYNRMRIRDQVAGTTIQHRGFGDVITRVKINLWGDDGGKTAFGLMPFVKIPTTQDQLGNDAFEGGFIVPLDVHLPGGWDLGVMTEFDCNQNATDSCYHLEFLNSLTFHHAIIGKLSGYGEFFGLASAERSAPWVGTLDGGLIYGFSENVQLDAGVNIGVTDAAADINPFVGFSMRF